jgi:transmembrane sensor
VRMLVVDKKNDAVISTTQPKNDIAPGKNGAILTLADGSTIALDSAGNGVIATQGNTNVVLENGKVSYAGGDKNATTAISYNTMSTPRGRQYQLVLPDGTKVWLNASSGITYPTAFTGDARKVSITGEAYFEVSHVTISGGKRAPFLVDILPAAGSASKGQVEVLGTHFNINAYGDEKTINTTLLEGSVKVKPEAGSAKSEVLKPGQQASMSWQSAAILVQPADVEQVVSWKNGFFNFDNIDIKNMFRQLERWYDIEVVFEGTVPDRLIYGKMQRELYLSQVLNILKKLGVNYRLEGKKLFVLP